MIFSQGVLDNPRWCCRVLAVTILTAVVADGAIAQDWHYVLRDGRRVSLNRSTNELGVVFRSHEQIEEASERLEAAGHGVVEDIKGAPNALVKILRVPRGGAGDFLQARVEEDAAVEEVQPVYRFPGADSPVVSTGTIVLKLRGDIDATGRDALWGQFRIVDVEEFKGLHDVYIVKPADGADEVILAETMADDSRTLWANPNFRRAHAPTQVAAPDEFFNLQWHLNNTGQTGGTEDADIDATEAWSIANGSGVLFGMLDTGCDVDHEDLRDNYIGIGQDIARPPFDDPRPKDSWEAHATQVMGLAAAAGNSIGVRGVAFRARFTATRGIGDFISEAGIASALTFALEQGVDVHINSWAPGIPNVWETPPVLEDAIETAFKEGRDLDGEGGDDPLGMVIVFGTGNESAEILPGFGPATLPQVIGVGASDGEDALAAFSNYGAALNFVAPGEGTSNMRIVTTDNEDDGIAPGDNVGGNSGFDIDPEGKYTGWFGGTSAACPIAAGVAGLILSVNEKLTATDVRIIMEHSCDQISLDDAQYDGVTSYSLKYGYGRINANNAVRAAQDSLSNGGYTWPDVPADVEIDKSTLRWKAGVGTDEFLVVESVVGFDLAPLEDACYDVSQSGCSDTALTLLPEGATARFVACNDLNEDCEAGSEQSVDFQRPAVGTKLLGIYGRNTSTGRYSFGARVEVDAVRPPAVTITASRLEGESPLVVDFNGNALSESGIDASGTAWDFDFRHDEGFTIDATTASATHTYEVAPGATRTFIARLMVLDELGVEGWAEVYIFVSGGPGEGAGAPLPTAAGGVRIRVSVPGTPGSDVSANESPFEVELRIDSDTPSSVRSVRWDLGDGSQASGLIVPHTYVNESDSPRTFVVIARATVEGDDGAEATTMASRVVTVLPGAAAVETGVPHLLGTETLGDGGSVSPCGAIGMIPLLFFGTASLMWLRRRHF